MTDFKVGDRVKYVHQDGYGTMRAGSTGTVVAVDDRFESIEVRWDAGTESTNAIDYSDRNETHDAEYLRLVENDQATVSAIVRHLRETGWPVSATVVEQKFATPQTRTVAVTFQVPEGKSVVDYLENVGIDYDIDGGN